MGQKVRRALDQARERIVARCALLFPSPPPPSVARSAQPGLRRRRTPSAPFVPAFFSSPFVRRDPRDPPLPSLLFPLCRASTRRFSTGRVEAGSRTRPVRRPVPAPAPEPPSVGRRRPVPQRWTREVGAVLASASAVAHPAFLPPPLPSFGPRSHTPFSPSRPEPSFSFLGREPASTLSALARTRRTVAEAPESSRRVGFPSRTRGVARGRALAFACQERVAGRRRAAVSEGTDARVGRRSPGRRSSAFACANGFGRRARTVHRHDSAENVATRRASIAKC